MDLLNYIKQSYERPNKAILKSLGASEELIKYLTESPWNTNFEIVKTLIAKQDEGGEDDNPRAIVGEAVVGETTLG